MPKPAPSGLVPLLIGARRPRRARHGEEIVGAARVADPRLAAAQDPRVGGRHEWGVRVMFELGGFDLDVILPEVAKTGARHIDIWSSHAAPVPDIPDPATRASPGRNQ